jgi:hypothetical protein
LRELFLILFCQQVFAFGDDEFRAMNREEGLAFAYVLIRCIRENLSNVAGDSRLNVGKSRFVDGRQFPLPGFHPARVSVQPLQTSRRWIAIAQRRAGWAPEEFLSVAVLHWKNRSKLIV